MCSRLISHTHHVNKNSPLKTFFKKTKQKVLKIFYRYAMKQLLLYLLLLLSSLFFCFALCSQGMPSKISKIKSEIAKQEKTEN